MQLFRKSILGAFVVSLFLSTNVAIAGDCTKRESVDWQATIANAVYVRDNCPSGSIVGTAKAGERVSIKEVDKHGDFYYIISDAGSGFVYKSALKDIEQSPLMKVEEKKEAKRYEDSIFWDLDPKHEYYGYISDVKNKGIVGGNPDGSVEPDSAINRAALAKILVEATNEDSVILGANLEAGVYSDAELGSWYAPYLKIARDMGVMTGDTGKNTVRPGDNANGAEVAKMVAEAFGMEVREKKDWEDWYDPYFEVLGEVNALPYNKGDHKVTRGEMMFMVSVITNMNNNNGL